MSEDKLNGISTFLTVVEAGSFAAAAIRINVTRSAVAKSIAKLEARLGVRLFHRTTRQQTLTDEGGRYYEHCSRLMANLRDMESALHDGRQGLEGRIRVSAPLLFGRRCVAPVLRSLMRAHPRLELEAEFSDMIVDVLADGFDLAIRIGSIADSTSLVARKIGRQQMAIFASPAYLAANGRPSSVADLRQHTGILYGRTPQARIWRVRDVDGSSQEVLLHGRERYDDLQVVADSAVQGGGLAWLPRWLGAPHVAAGELELVMDMDRVLSVDIHAVWPQNKYLPLRTRTLIDALTAEVPILMGE
ncbi:LysR family transcriptional regulator [Herbaspirillum hiltneri N3]|uniref:LysR family transcriptional regulator n=1 Tax=Herbaspirillum hiltneri N3 TaxID=1262470 RepID=A0ABN4I0F2_9BURK|nr:LysR family transcriptional regulator [Herbaspirillum hiltneri]AKZ64495.1 LysR family transcriptional regulator [Herbaspirillum hiltneri N3]